MNLAALSRDMPIRRKLILIAVLSVGAALLFAALVSMVYQWFLLRAELVKTTHSQASIVAANSTAALFFNDRDAANQTLEALGAFDNIEFAMVHDKQGKSFALFVPAGREPPPRSHSSQAHEHLFTATYLDVFQPIVFEGERIGTIHVRSGLAPIYRQMGWSAVVVAAAAVGGLGLALLLIATLHPAITGPIAKLVGLMDVISSEKNYALRADSRGKDELGALAREFNDMLAQVQARDEALAQHRAHLEQEVAQRTASLNEAQHIAHLGSWEWDIVNDTLSWSDEIYRIFGLAPQQFDATYETFMRFVHPDDRNFVDEEVRQTLEEGRVYSQNHRIQLPDGTVRHVHEQGEVSFGEDGRVTRMVGTVQDITERRQAEERIRESEARYRSIFEYANDIIFLMNLDGTFRSISPAIERIAGWKAEEWIGKSFAPLVHADDLANANAAFQKVLAGESIASLRLRIARKSGEYFGGDLSSTPLGHDVILGIVRDVTERQRAEVEIRKLNEELETRVQERTRQLLEAQEDLVRKEKLATLGQVAGSVGHELRNPLGVMNNAVYFLQTVLSDADETTREYLKIIKDEIASSERIVSDLLDSVRTKPPRPETVGAGELIGQTLRKIDIPSRITVKLDIPETLSSLQADAQQIQQVFRNLITNGVEAMQEGGELEIRAVENKPEGQVVISVRDTGAGIAPDILPKLFQPLFTTKSRGIGLGLVVVKNLTEANGGTLAVQSEVGQGTTFTVALPAARSIVGEG